MRNFHIKHSGGGWENIVYAMRKNFTSTFYFREKEKFFFIHGKIVE